MNVSFSSSPLSFCLEVRQLGEALQSFTFPGLVLQSERREAEDRPPKREVSRPVGGLQTQGVGGGEGLGTRSKKGGV